MMFSHQTAKDQEMGMVCKAWAGWWMTLAWTWRARHPRGPWARRNLAGRPCRPALWRPHGRRTSSLGSPVGACTPPPRECTSSWISVITIDFLAWWVIHYASWTLLANLHCVARNGAPRPPRVGPDPPSPPQDPSRGGRGRSRSFPWDSERGPLCGNIIILKFITETTN
jgi:hypothetical protein